ncbi:hydrolase [Lithospermum erythrorhizon]|uniref:Hydrolase n=1 Tax=Lithospermum erythrorhizon TaxID=34254 RepID=A0AAV3PJM3_LITER
MSVPKRKSSCLGFLANQPTLPSIDGDNDESQPGRILAYRERGAPRNKASYKIIIVHGFGSSKDMSFMASQVLLYKPSIFIVLYFTLTGEVRDLPVLFDRAGYGESDPNPKRSLKSEASDIEELADQLELGSKFYVIGFSIGCYPTWTCLKHLPHRIAGAALVVPYINYKWPSLPDDLVKDDYRKKLARWMVFVARYTPGLLRWWFTQNVFPSSTVFDRNPKFFSPKDMEVLKNTPGYQLFSKNKIGKRRVFDSLRHDFIVAFGKWDFDPLELQNPYDEKGKRIHIWQGCEDKVVPCEIQRFIAKRLSWISYHEVPDGGHLLVYDSVVCEAVLRSLLVGEDPPLYRPK